MKTIRDTAAPSRGQTESNGEIISKTGEVATAENGEMKIWEDGKVGKKPRYLIASKSVINLKSDFQHKLLCDGPTFTAGHACSLRREKSTAGYSAACPAGSRPGSFQVVAGTGRRQTETPETER